MRLLVTRPEPDATQTARTLRARGHDMLVVPLLRTQTIDVAFSGPYAAVLMTSANAARALASHPRAAELTRLPALTVGARSAEAARAAGFGDVTSADGALGDLVALAASRFAGGSLLYLAGEDRAGDLAGELAAHGVTVETAVIYRAVAAERLPAELQQALSNAQLDGALHYSRRSVTTLIELSRAAGVLDGLLDLAHTCLSDEVAAPLRNAGAGRISVAPHPDETALIGLL
ncbi:MAG: uroporphyrinogen-III synthase [Hyphomicrobiales bacterium]|jgi:uroporphyrinogen-III synthase|nr:uroporphyrinogen-III synthase [Hyphomicrobiales bacterium]